MKHLSNAPGAQVYIQGGESKTLERAEREDLYAVHITITHTDLDAIVQQVKAETAGKDPIFLPSVTIVDPDDGELLAYWGDNIKDIFYAPDNDEADHDGMEVVTIAVTGDDDEE